MPMRRHRFRPPGLPRAAGRWVSPLLAAALPLLAVASTGRAAPGDGAFPPPETFRKLRLLTLDCGRDNTAGPCDQARAIADPLLDHPRLSASCKDALWAIRQKARVAPVNSFQRRDPIDQAAQDVVAFCRQQIPKPREEEKPQGPAAPGGLFTPAPMTPGGL